MSSDELKAGFEETNIKEVAAFLNYVNKNCIDSKFISALLHPSRLRPQGRHFVARKDGKVIGAAAFAWDGTQWELVTIYVLKRFRGNGFGRSFAQFAIQKMLDLGAASIYSEAVTRQGSGLLKHLLEDFGERLTVLDRGEPYEVLTERDDC